jgi:hypothetical protein
MGGNKDDDPALGAQIDEYEQCVDLLQRAVKKALLIVDDADALVAAHFALSSEVDRLYAQRPLGDVNEPDERSDLPNNGFVAELHAMMGRTDGDVGRAAAALRHLLKLHVLQPMSDVLGRALPVKATIKERAKLMATTSKLKSKYASLEKDVAKDHTKAEKLAMKMATVGHEKDVAQESLDELTTALKTSIAPFVAEQRYAAVDPVVRRFVQVESVFFTLLGKHLKRLKILPVFVGDDDDDDVDNDDDNDNDDDDDGGGEDDWGADADDFDVGGGDGGKSKFDNSDDDNDGGGSGGNVNMQHRGSVSAIDQLSSLKSAKTNNAKKAGMLNKFRRKVLKKGQK